jgi:zinc finger BED domain-containing protein 1 (E3 SUMO-protein ligase ZBED1)
MSVNLEDSQITNSCDTPSSTLTPVNTSVSLKRKTYKKSSIIWDHYDKIIEGNITKLKCKACGKSYNWHGSTTNMKAHVKDAHGTNIDVDCGDESESNTIDQESARKKKKFEAIDQQLLKAIISTNNPFRMVEDDQIKKLFWMLNPSYKLPNRKKLSGQLLSKEYDLMVSMLASQLEEARSISITLDIWTSKQRYPYLGVTCHFFDKNQVLVHQTLTIEHLSGSHEASILKPVILNILIDWKIQQKLVAIVTDNASNMVKLGQELIESFNQNSQKIYRISCAAHILNLIVGRLSKKVDPLPESQSQEDDDQEDGSYILDNEEKEFLEGYKTLIARCRRVAAAFHQSNNLSELLRLKQKQLKINEHELIQDVSTRWNSTYLLLERMLEQIDAINETFADKNFRKKYDHLIFSESDKQMLQSLIDILYLFYEATLNFSGVKYATLSIVWPTFNALINNLESDSDDTDSKAAIKKILLYYTKYYVEKYDINRNPILITATYLDIRTKQFGRVTDKKKKEFQKIAINTIREFCFDLPEELRANMFNNFSMTEESELNKKKKLAIFDYNNDNNTKKTKKKLIGIEKEINDYESEQPKNIDPIEYWKINKENFPILFHIFKKIFSIPATSVPAEQLFSHAGYAVI